LVASASKEVAKATVTAVKENPDLVVAAAKAGASAV
jgi:hypothetical protein